MRKKLFFIIGLFGATGLVAGCKEPTQELMQKQVDRQYLETEICKFEGQCVFYDDVTWFIDEGFVFTYQESTRQKTYMDGYDAAKIIDFHGQVVAKNYDQEVWITAQKENGSPSWHRLGVDARDILAWDSHLVVLTPEGEIMMSKGVPGPVKVTLIPIIHKVGNISYVQFIPVFNGKRIQFESTGVKWAKAIYVSDDHRLKYIDSASDLELGHDDDFAPAM